MRIERIDHVGIIVNDLVAAKAFFLDFGLELQGEGDLEGTWLDRIVGLDDVKTSFAFFRAPDGQAAIELITFHSPPDEHGIQLLPANAPGIRHIAFAVEDIEAAVARLEARGAEPFGAIQDFEGTYKLCYVRGPEGIILELAEHVS